MSSACCLTCDLLCLLYVWCHPLSRNCVVVVARKELHKSGLDFLLELDGKLKEIKSASHMFCGLMNRWNELLGMNVSERILLHRKTTPKHPNWGN